MRAELEELDQIWAMARIFRKPIGRPGYVKVTVPTPNGMSVLSLRVERASQSLAKTIEDLHSYLYWDFGVLKNAENAVKSRDAIVQASAEESGAQLRVRLIVRKVKGSFVVERYDDLVAQEGEDVKEHLEFLNRLMGGSFIVEAAEMKGEGGQKVCDLPKVSDNQSDR
jgi:hypothetical protein